MATQLEDPHTPSGPEEASSPLWRLSLRHARIPGVMFVVAIGTLIIFSFANRHWFNLYTKLAHPGAFQAFAIDLSGAVPLAAVTSGVVALSAVLVPVLLRHKVTRLEAVLWTGTGTIAIVGISVTALAIAQELYEISLLIVFGALAICCAVLLSRGSTRAVVIDWWRAPDVDHLRDAMPLPVIWRRLLTGFIVVVSAGLLFHSATEPVYDYDALIYHYAMGKILVAHHGMPLITGPSPGLEMSANYPPLYPALGAFTLLFAHGNDLYFRLLSSIVGIMIAGAAWCIGYRFAGRSVALLAAAFTLTAQIVGLYSVYGTLYTLMGFLLSMAFVALIAYVRERSLRHLAFAGAALGLVFLCSYQAFIYLVWLLPVAWFLWRAPNRTMSTVLRGLLAFGLPLVAIGAFWYVRNWAVLGDPTYPWYYHVFGGIDLNSPLTTLDQASVTQVAQQLAYSTGVGKVVSIGGILLFNRSLFPVLSPFAIVGFVLGWKRLRGPSRAVLLLTIPCAVVPIFMFIATGTFFLRYFIPSIPILSILPAYAFARWADSTREGTAWRSQADRLTFPTLVLTFMLIFPGLFVLLAGQFYY